MMSYKNKEVYFQKIIRVSLLISLSLLTLIFYFFQRFERLPEFTPNRINVDIYVTEIPKTIQRKTGRPIPPPRPLTGVPQPAEEFDFPEEIFISEVPGNETSPGMAQGVPVEISAKPLLETYPDVSAISCTGVIRLLLLINAFGKIESIEVLENSTESVKCLELAKHAAQKSIWLPAKVGNKPVKSWLTKVYKFNVKR